jgi:hypothetical protein
VALAVVAWTCLERDLAYRDAASEGEINAFVILNNPARCDEHRIYLFSGDFLWSASPHFAKHDPAAIVGNWLGETMLKQRRKTFRFKRW